MSHEHRYVSGTGWTKMPARKSSGYCKECGTYQSTLYAGRLCSSCSTPDGPVTDHRKEKGNCQNCRKYREIDHEYGLCGICRMTTSVKPRESGLQCKQCEQFFNTLTAGGLCFKCSKGG